MSIRKVVPISDADWRLEPLPSWVDPWEPDWEFEAPEDAPIALLLVDEQHHVASQSISNRIVRQVLTRAALGSFGQVEINFDPATRRLKIHDVVIWRKQAGEWQGRQVTPSLEFVVRERGSQETLNRRVSITAALEGLREGDAIDLSWTLEPRELPPELPFTAFHGFVWSVPTGITHFSLHLDPAMPVAWRLHCPPGIEAPVHESSPEPARWEQRRPLLTKLEPNAPPGRWNFPVLEASAWRDWQEVAEFADALWADAVSDAPDAIADAVARLRGDGDLAGSVCNLIRFVQDEIDFQDGGFGSGAGHFPSGSGTVLRQRMGDAKDKAILLTALLRQAGVEAWPFLVNPGWQDSITSMLPSWAVFNHVIVTFIVDGQRHFVDPSDGIQRGDLADWIPPSYGFGLEVRPGVTRLTAMPQRPEAQLTLTETFYLDRKHQGGFVEQVLHATRWLADDIRDAIAHEGKTAFLKAHMEALEQQFPALVPDKAGGDLTEDPASDAIEWRGRHSLPTWGPPGEAPPVDFRYGAHGLFLAVEMIEPPQERTIPWALRHPMRVQHVVHVRSKDIPRAKPETRRHRGPGFRYSCDVVSKQGEVTFSYLWETTASQVEAGEWPDYCRERSKAFTDAEAHVVTKSSSSNRAALFALLAFAIVAGIGGWGILRFHRSSPAVTAPEVAQAKPVAPESPQPAPAEPPKTESPPAKKPVDPEVQVALEAASRGDFASAEPVFEKQQAQYQESAAFQFMRAELALRLGQLDRAREALTRGRELDPSNVTGDLLGAVLLRAEGNLTDAKQLVSETTERHPADPRVLRELANTLGQSGDLKGAKDAWGQLLALTPGDPDALLHYSVLLWQNGEKEQADAMITKALAAQTAPNAAIEAAAGDYYTYTGRPVEAIERLEKAVILAPEDRARRFALTFGNLRLGRTAHAVELARSLAHEFPMDVRSWNALAIADASNGDQEGAEAAFREWLRIAPQDPIAAANFGFFLHQCGRSIEARDLLAESTVKFPGEGMVWLNYAVVLEALGDKESANAAKLKADGLLTHEQKESMIH